jgi:UDP-glucose 4-epimerase
VSINDIIKLISKSLDKKIIIKKGSLKKGGTLRRCPDITKIKKIGYKQKYTLLNGLKKTVDWYKLDYEKK